MFTEFSQNYVVNMILSARVITYYSRLLFNRIKALKNRILVY